MSTATDPNGWLPAGTQPGSVLVKIVGTSRDTLNGQLAVVLTFVEDKGRYLVHMTKSQQQASLKPENLLKASWMEQMQGQYELIQNNPEVKRQITDYYNAVQQRLPARVKPEYAAVAGFVLLLGVMYLVGFSKTLLALSFVLMVVMVIAPDLGSPPAAIARNFPMRVRTVIRQQIPFVGNRIADNQYLSMALVGLVLFFFVNALFLKAPTKATSTTAASSWSPGTVSPHLGTAASNKALLEEYYQKGFEDGTAGNAFGASMPVPVAAEEPMTSSSGAKGFDESEFDYSRMPPPPPPKKSGLDWSVMLSVMFLGRTIYSLGAVEGGGWDYQLALASLRNMDQMRMGFFAFSLYRLGSQLYQYLK